MSRRSEPLRVILTCEAMRYDPDNAPADESEAERFLQWLRRYPECAAVRAYEDRLSRVRKLIVRVDNVHNRAALTLRPYMWLVRESRGPSLFVAHSPEQIALFEPA